MKLTSYPNTTTLQNTDILPIGTSDGIKTTTFETLKNTLSSSNGGGDFCRVSI